MYSKLPLSFFNITVLMTKNCLYSFTHSHNLNNLIQHSAASS